MNKIEVTSDLSLQHLASFDEAIDVRAPEEFREDHLPQAINLPVLSDCERAEVGTIYTQESQFQARRIGASYVSQNIARYLTGELADKPQDYRPLIYCWRGGLRSRSMATILASVGWNCTTLEGGYQSWRRLVVSELREKTSPFPIVLLDGQTGTGKTEILKQLAQQGVQTLNLEGIAEHRGSSFGGFDGIEQPPQKLFESRLYSKLMSLDLKHPIVVEGESRMVGRCAIPCRLIESIRSAPRIEIKSTVEARSHFLVHQYADWKNAPDRLYNAISNLRRQRRPRQVEHWLDLANQKQFEELAASLMTGYYDPCYDRQRKKRADRPIAEFEIEKLERAEFKGVAEKIADLIGSSTAEVFFQQHSRASSACAEDKVGC